MSKIFVFLESQNGKLKKGGLELLSWAKGQNLECSAGLIGNNLSSLATDAGKYGAKSVFTCEAEDGKYNPELYAASLKEMIKASGATVVLANASMLAKDCFPRVAAKLDTGIASDCVNIKMENGKLIATKPLYAGKCTAEVEFSEGALPIVLMRSNQLPVMDASADASPEIKVMAPPQTEGHIQLEKVEKGSSNKPDLTEANVIVAGGRGLGEAKNFELLEKLAEVLGATVGASRAVVDAGWVPHTMQVGQTGKTVAPSLYIAVGVSGAIQHLAGMSGSKVIVAINKDGDAPIFQKASYGLVGDLFQILPPLQEELKKALS